MEYNGREKTVLVRQVLLSYVSNWFGRTHELDLSPHHRLFTGKGGFQHVMILPLFAYDTSVFISYI